MGAYSWKVKVRRNNWTSTTDEIVISGQSSILKVLERVRVWCWKSFRSKSFEVIFVERMEPCFV
jgi:hypothetical protein